MSDSSSPDAATRELRFSGASDDLCEVDGDVKGADEYDNCASRDGKHAFAFIVRQGEEVGLRVNALYDGCWSFAVGQLLEDCPLPPWPIRVEPCHPYSTQLVLTVPSDVEVVRDSLNY
jgi:hypothetical protein